jgi:hypothetical protein
MLHSGTPCPWCGRVIILSRSGVLPRHKAVTGTHPIVTDYVIREWCAGGGELPFALTGDQRRYLRAQWRDEGGQLIGDDDS